ncbi:unnamed protein product, partial [Urochloa humidicola]
ICVRAEPPPPLQGSPGRRRRPQFLPAASPQSRRTPPPPGGGGGVPARPPPLLPIPPRHVPGRLPQIRRARYLPSAARPLLSLGASAPIGCIKAPPSHPVGTSRRLNHLPDPETKEFIKKILLLTVRFLDMWEPAVLAIKREGYNINCNGQRGVVITEKFQQALAVSVHKVICRSSKNLQIKEPH